MPHEHGQVDRVTSRQPGRAEYDVLGPEDVAFLDGEHLIDTARRASRAG